MTQHRTVSLERKRDETVEVVEGDESFFPHSMFLDDEDIKKLGVADLELGDERELRAMVRVTSISSNESEDSGKSNDLTLSLIEGEIAQPARSQADRIFGGDDGGDK